MGRFYTLLSGRRRPLPRVGVDHWRRRMAVRLTKSDAGSRSRLCSGSASGLDSGLAVLDYGTITRRLPVCHLALVSHLGYSRLVLDAG